MVKNNAIALMECIKSTPLRTSVVPHPVRHCPFMYWLAVVVMIIWQLDLQPPMQSVPITTEVVSLNPVHDEVYPIQHYVIKLAVTCNRSAVFSGYSGFLRKTDRYDITEILLKVSLKLHKPKPNLVQTEDFSETLLM